MAPESQVDNGRMDWEQRMAARAAAVPRGSLHMHDAWHKTLRDSTGPMGFLSGGKL